MPYISSHTGWYIKVVHIAFSGPTCNCRQILMPEAADRGSPFLRSALVEQTFIQHVEQVLTAR